MDNIMLQLPKDMPGIAPLKCGSLIHIGDVVLVVTDFASYRDDDKVIVRCRITDIIPEKKEAEEDKPDLSIFFSKDVPGYVVVKNRNGRMLPPDIDFSNQTAPDSFGGYGHCRLTVNFKASDVFYGK